MIFLFNLVRNYLLRDTEPPDPPLRDTEPPEYPEDDLKLGVEALLLYEELRLLL